MLDLINRYCHGFVLIPVLLACRKKKLFDLLQQVGPMTLQQLTDRMGANDGHLRIALRMFQSLRWISRDDVGRYSPTPEVEIQKQIPEDVSRLFDLSIDSYLAGNEKEGILREWIDRSAGRWDVESSLMGDFLDGILVIRVLLAVKKNNLLEVSDDGRMLSFPRTGPVAREELSELFLTKGWVENEGASLVFTDLGRFLVDRIMITGVTASYAPMLGRISDLLFGNPHEVNARDAGGHEVHVDRSLNVVASGFQHEKYFAAIDEMILSAFDVEPYEKQPKYVADMGCGDGTLLRRIYELIRTRSKRGRVLGDYPLTMIGIDYNEEALRATKLTLDGIPSFLLKGDIADPERMVDELRGRGIGDPEKILHVRSFLDHDRPFLPPARLPETRARSVLPYDGAYVDSDGRTIPAHVAVQGLVEHLQRWSAVVGDHGLIIAEVHCLDPHVVHEFLDRSESLHFDAYHAFSMQHLVEAEVFLMAAAEAGLFPRPDFSERFPRTFPFTRITINWFEKRPYTVRNPRLGDLDELIRLEEECLSEPLRATPDEIRRRLQLFPGGHCVLELEGRIAGVIYSQRIPGVGVLRNSNVTKNQGHHTKDGEIVQLLGISVLPEFQDKSLGDQLLEFMLQWSSLKSGVKGIAGVTRCKNFGYQTSLSLEEYIGSRNDQGDLNDPILRFHETHGARIVECLPEYRPLDKVNEGTGVLIEYDIHNRQDRHRFGGRDTFPDKARDSGECPDVRSTVETFVRSLMGRRGRTPVPFSPDHTLRELGLDSLDLMELKSLFADRLGKELDSTFFFKYPTPRSISLFYEGKEPETPRREKTGHAPSAEKRSGQELLRKPSRDFADTRLDDDSASAGVPFRKAGQTEPVAIVGMSCRFPGGADDVDSYWTLLRDGMDAITEVPETRWDSRPFSREDGDDTWRTATRFGGFLSQVDTFDAQFFRIAPAEAEHIDPQQRLLLETSWEALESAGLDPHALKETPTGVFVGIHTHDYEMLQLKETDGEYCSPYFATSNSASVASGRLSYFFGLHGPSVSVDTACSSSMTALHLACRSLRDGECDLAIVGGVNLILAPELSVTYSKLGMLSKDGRCKTFDAGANGYVRSEGCAVVVLKRLREAIYDHDDIRAVVRGSAVNQDGQSNGLTAPNGFAQEAVIRKALKAAGVLPADVSYVEAHGTGTPLGDPVEMKALEAVYGRGRQKEQPLVIGSVKTNIGHAEAAAGLAGLIKVVLSLRHDYIPPHLHFETLNPHISLESFPAVIPTEGMEWKRPVSGEPRLAGVSSFGSSGTNVHLILQDPPSRGSSSADRDEGPRLFTLSAKSEDGLRQLARAHDSYLGSHPELLIDDVCFTAGAGRAHFEHRLALIAGSTQAVRGKLDAFVVGKTDDSEILWGRVADRPERGLAFLFTGQGSQYVGMGRELFENEPRFRATLQRCADILDEYLEKPLLDVLYPPPGVYSPLDQTYYTQPALFALEYALADLWGSWGIEPSFVMGHSVGEYVAACLAGVFSLEDGLKLIAARARLMQSLPRDGKMVVLFADEARVALAVERYADTVSVATINGPTNTVISGLRRAVDDIVAALAVEGLKSFELTVSHAFHSPLMEPMIADFRKVAAEVRFSPPRVDIVSNVTGRTARDDVASPDYWCNHVRQAVRFAAGMNALFESGCTTFVEIGPKPILLGMGRGCLPGGRNARGVSDLKWLPSLKQGEADRTQLLQSLAALYVSGHVVDWKQLNHGRQARKVALPSYPWQRKRYWLAGPAGPFKKTFTRRDSRSLEGRFPEGRRLLSPALRDSCVFEFVLDIDSMPYLRDHLVCGEILLPAPVLVQIAMSSAGSAFGDRLSVMEDFHVDHALVFDEKEDRTVQVVLKPEERGGVSFEVLYLSSGKDGVSWESLASGRMESFEPQDGAFFPVPFAADYREVQERCREQVSVEAFYRAFAERGVDLGPLFRAIESMTRSADAVVAGIRLPEALRKGLSRYDLHPVLLDACLQTLMAASSGADTAEDAEVPYLFFGIEKFRRYPGIEPSPLCFAVVRSTQSDEEMRVGDARFFNEGGECLAEARGICLKRASRERVSVRGAAVPEASLFGLVWRPVTSLDRDKSSAPASILPGPLEIARKLEGSEIEAPDSLQHSSEGLLSGLDRICTMGILAALHRLGWKSSAGASASVEKLCASLEIADRHRRLLNRMLEILREDAILKGTDPYWEVIRAPDKRDWEGELAALTARYPDHAIELDLLGVCLRNLASVLHGDCDATSLLFPEGSITMADRLYTHSPLFRRMNELARRTAAIVAGRVAEGRTLRALEIGGGTGGTTAHILPELPPDRTEYLFTDISGFFLDKVREKFREYPFVTYGTLDIEKDPEKQGLAPHRFDLVLASNVVHATADLRVSLRHIRSLLAPGGLMVLVEGVRPARWIDLIFGLTAGWWRFVDTDLRPNHPLMTRDGWLGLLERQHFEEAAAIPPGNGQSGEVFEQALVVARGPIRTISEEDRREVALPNEDTLEQSAGERQNWLILADRSGVGEGLATTLAARGHTCTVVYPGQRYEVLPDGRYTVNPANPGDYGRLCRDILGPAGSAFRTAVFLWGIDAEFSAGRSVDVEERAAAVTLSLVRLIKEFLVSPGASMPRVLIATRGAQSLSQKETPQLSQCPLWGLGRVLAEEHPELWEGLIDLDPEGTVEEAARDIVRLAYGDGTTDQVSVRAGSIYVPCLTPLQSASDFRFSFDPEGNYVITGGLGALGMETAAWMVEQGARRLILLNRTPLPDRSEWDCLDPDSPHFRRVSVIRGLETSGVLIKILSADVGDEKELRSLLPELREDGWSPIRGVIHTAAVARDTLLSRFDEGEFCQVWKSKAKGAWLLHQLLEGQPLDFFVLFSSIGSLLGQVGQGSYAAANAFLDGLAHYRSSNDLPATCVNWGPWSGSGLALTKGGRATIRSLSLRGIEAVAVGKATSAMGTLMGKGVRQAAVMGIDRKKLRTWSSFDSGYLPLSQWTRHMDDNPLQPVSGRTSVRGEKEEDSHPVRDRLLVVDQGQRRTVMEEHLSAMVAGILKLDVPAIGPEEPFGTLGLDSLMALQLRNHCEKGLRLKLPTSLAWNFPTIRSLGAYLLERLGLGPNEVDDAAPRGKGGNVTTIDESGDAGVLDSVERLSDEEALKALMGKVKS